MGASAADEKRQEERRIKELRDFQRSTTANRHCFDCNEMMPQYVCLDFNTFVCTACSGIHREFAHRVKSISMSKFTETEVKNMIKFGGNDAAQKYWRAKHDPSFRPNGGTDGERTRNFIRLTYIDRKWVYESPRHSSADQPQSSSKNTKSTGKTSSKTASRDKDVFSGDGGGFDAFGTSSTGATSGGDGGFANFGDFSAFESTASASTPGQGFADFGAFDSPTTATPAAAAAAPSGFADFGSFDSAPSSSQPPPEPVPAKHEFASFKIAPPPGTQFASSTASTASSTPGGAVAPAKPANDFMAFSPEHKKSSDPFSFEDATPPAPATGSSSSPFDAFSEPVSAPVTTPASTATPSFDAFGDSGSTSSFDAFGTSSPPQLDPFGAKPAGSTGGNGLDIFGAASASASAAAANAAADPFGAFNPPTSTGSASIDQAKPAAAAADPFSAFDTIETSISTPAGPATASFSSSRGESGHMKPTDGLGVQSVPQVSNNDPFAFASGDNMGSGSKTSSFSGMGSASPMDTPNPFGQGMAPMQQVHHPTSTGGFAAPGYHPAYVQQQQAMMQQQHQHPQQQWYGPNPALQGHPQQNMGFHGHLQQPQQMYSVTQSAPTSQATFSRDSSSSQLKAAASSATSINDPFASLSISNTIGTAATSVSRGNSFNAQPSATSSSSLSHGNPPGNPVVGATGSFGNPTMSTVPGSRGQSFQSSSMPASSLGGPSSTSSFTYQQPPPVLQAPSPSQSPMGSFSFPAPPAAPGLAAFPSGANASRPNSFTQPPNQTAGASANPFDMF